MSNVITTRQILRVINELELSNNIDPKLLRTKLIRYFSNVLNINFTLYYNFDEMTINPNNLGDANPKCYVSQLDSNVISEVSIMTSSNPIFRFITDLSSLVVFNKIINLPNAALNSVQLFNQGDITDKHDSIAVVKLNIDELKIIGDHTYSPFKIINFNMIDEVHKRIIHV